MTHFNSLARSVASAAMARNARRSSLSTAAAAHLSVGAVFMARNVREAAAGAQ